MGNLAFWNRKLGGIVIAISRCIIKPTSIKTPSNYINNIDTIRIIKQLLTNTIVSDCWVG